jgi:hypothetical protein
LIKVVLPVPLGPMKNVTEPFFNDMRKIEMAPASAQASAG